MSENSVEVQKTEDGCWTFIVGAITGLSVMGALFTLGSSLSDKQVKEDGIREGRNEARTLTACDQIAEAWPKTTGWNVGDNDCDRVGWEIFSGGKYVTMSQYKRIPRK